MTAGAIYDIVLENLSEKEFETRAEFRDAVDAAVDDLISEFGRCQRSMVELNATDLEVDYDIKIKDELDKEEE